MKDYSKADFWAEKARAEGYPARSVYKLEELDKKFSIFPKNGGVFSALDLGAAPGSWSLYILRKFRERARLASCDLSPLSASLNGIAPPPRFTFIQGDFTTQGVRDKIAAFGPYDLVLSDAAPATTGNRIVDTARSVEIVHSALDYAESVLKEGGALVVKIFQGGDAKEILARAEGAFSLVKTHKPVACRKESFETYVVCKGIKK